MILIFTVVPQIVTVTTDSTSTTPSTTVLQHLVRRSGTRHFVRVARREERRRGRAAQSSLSVWVWKYGGLVVWDREALLEWERRPREADKESIQKLIIGDGAVSGRGMLHIVF